MQILYLRQSGDCLHLEPADEDASETRQKQKRQQIAASQDLGDYAHAKPILDEVQARYEAVLFRDVLENPLHLSELRDANRQERDPNSCPTATSVTRVVVQQVPGCD